MALYLGSSKELRINSRNGEVLCLHIVSSSSHITNNISLLTSDNCILKDSNGLYITIAKEVE